jgi:hypothetical protein
MRGAKTKSPDEVFVRAFLFIKLPLDCDLLYSIRHSLIAA